MTEALSSSMILLISGWTSGISIYLTIVCLGISGRFGWIALPGELQALTNPLIIFAAIAIYLIEFAADKVPFIDSAWDSLHTFIRPLGAAGLGYLAGADQGMVAQTLYAMMTGTVALNTHAFKATTRLAINTSPEPFSNIGASVAEHSAVILVFWFFIKHPILASLLVILILIISFLLIRAMWRFAKKLFQGRRSPAQIKTEITATTAATPSSESTPIH